MGITGELVRSVFSRNNSVGTQDTNGRNNGEKKRWSSVRLYLCGEEFNSVLAEEDSASVKSSEATVTQPIFQDSIDKSDALQSEEAKEGIVRKEEKHNSTSRLFREEDAAITIQSAFRNFLANRQRKRIESKEDKEEVAELTEGSKSPSGGSVSTSIEVQTGNSVEVLSAREENFPFYHRLQKKPRAQVLKLKEEWDDSTVSSNVTKMRIQNRLEATNRRERALAYAFSQQLRICTKKKQRKADGSQPNLSWTWLERWMATRTECSVESHTGKQLEPVNSPQGLGFQKSFFDVAMEEKESCGSNEVSLQFDSLSISSASVKNGFKTTGSRLKNARTISRRKTAPSNQCSKEHRKVMKKEYSKETEQDKEKKPMNQVAEMKSYDQNPSS